MKPELKFMRCKLCGNIVTYLHASGVTPVCCGQDMVELTANTEDAATEKHVWIGNPFLDKITPNKKLL